MDFPKTSAAHYNDTVVRQFSIMAVVWGVVGMLVGVFIAAQLAWPELNFGIPWLSLWPFAPTAYQCGDFCFWWLRSCSPPATTWCSVPAKLALFAPALGSFHLLGLASWSFWLAVITLPLGYTSGKEYAELEWPIDILITLVWVSYAIVFFGTVGTRKVKHIYVANWFFGAFIMAVALLHLVNSAASACRLHEELLGLCWRAGCHGSVVVRPQCRGLLPDRRLPGHDVLLHPQASWSSRVLVSPVDRALLGPDLHLHVGGSSPPALHSAA